jgi:predicted transcriptional regulator of viral defense system
MRVREFIDTHKVFTYREFAVAHDGDVPSATLTRDTLLKQYVQAGRLVRVRSELFVTVPLGVSPAGAVTDPMAVAAKMATDAVLAYHTALEYHGAAYAIHSRLTYLTGVGQRALVFQGITYTPVPFPRVLVNGHRENVMVDEGFRGTTLVRVTSRERTLVDVLDRVSLSGGWEEVWRSLEVMSSLDLESVVTYALALGNATTIAKVGFFLEQHGEQFAVGNGVLERLRTRVPRGLHYADRGRASAGRLVEQWHLIMPVTVLDRDWEEDR